jgi:hypothetical protein
MRCLARSSLPVLGQKVHELSQERKEAGQCPNGLQLQLRIVDPQATSFPQQATTFIVYNDMTSHHGLRAQ